MRRCFRDAGRDHRQTAAIPDLTAGSCDEHLGEEILTRPLNLREVAARLTHEFGEGDLLELERDLQAECASVRLRPGIAAIWRDLPGKGLRIGV
jgi:hypothetical protein